MKTRKKVSKKIGYLSNKLKRKQRYRRNQYKSMSKEHKQKLIEYRKYDIKVFWGKPKLSEKNDY